MKLWTMIALIVLMTVSTYPRAAKAITGMTGNELLGYCENEGVYSQGLCDGFIDGAGDGFQSYALYIGRRLPFCYPEGATVGQVRRVIVKYLEEHPQDLHYSAADSAFIALGDAFPCD